MGTKPKKLNILDYELVIFDLDGTLVHTAPDIVESVKHILKHFDCKMKSDDEIISSIGGGARKVLLKNMGDQGEAHIERALEMFRDYYIENCAKKSMLYPGVVQLLEYLKNNKVKSALCTLKIREATIRILKDFTIIDHFQMIITADDITLPKQNPEGIHKILNHLNVDKCKSVLIGDTVSDIMAGKNGQIETIGVAYGYESLEAIKNAKPGFIIGDLNELLEK